MRIFSGSLPLATTNTFPTFPAAMPLYLSFKLITSRIRLTEDWEDPQIFVRHVFPPNFPTEPCWVAKKRNLTEYQPVIFFCAHIWNRSPKMMAAVVQLSQASSNRSADSRLRLTMQGIKLFGVLCQYLLLVFNWLRASADHWSSLHRISDNEL